MLTKLSYYCATKCRHNGNGTHMKVNYGLYVMSKQRILAERLTMLRRLKITVLDGSKASWLRNGRLFSFRLFLNYFRRHKIYFEAGFGKNDKAYFFGHHSNMIIGSDFEVAQQ